MTLQEKYDALIGATRQAVSAMQGAHPHITGIHQTKVRLAREILVDHLPETLEAAQDGIH